MEIRGALRGSRVRGTSVHVVLPSAAPHLQFPSSLQNNTCLPLNLSTLHSRTIDIFPLDQDALLLFQLHCTAGQA